MKLAAQIFDWLNAVKADRRLSASSCFKIAYQLSNRINAAEFKKTGRLMTWQSIATLSAATGIKNRMVRYAVRRLEAAGHVAIEAGHGPRRSNRYILIQQKRQPVAAYNGANSGNGLPHSHEQKRQSDVPIGAIIDTNSGNQLPPNLSISNFSNRRAREPRRAEEALGLLGAELRKRINPATFDAWFTRGEAEIVSQTTDTVTIAVRSKFCAEQIRIRFESDIAGCLPGVVRVEFVVKERDEQSA